MNCHLLKESMRDFPKTGRVPRKLGVFTFDFFFLWGTFLCLTEQAISTVLYSWRLERLRIIVSRQTSSIFAVSPVSIACFVRFSRSSWDRSRWRVGRKIESVGFNLLKFRETSFSEAGRNKTLFFNTNINRTYRNMDIWDGLVCRVVCHPLANVYSDTLTCGRFK